MTTSSVPFALPLLLLLFGCGSEPPQGSNSEGDSSGGATTDDGKGPLGGSAGSIEGAAGGSASDSPPPSGASSVLVAVGYSGQKLRSTDGGRTWTEPAIDPWVGQQEDPSCNPESEECKLLCTGGDDKCLLRDVTFYDGLFVAVGWKIFTSTDGLEWTERTVEKQQWMGGVEYGNGGWLAVGGCGQFLTSENGVDWVKGGSATEGCGHLRNLAFGAGVFVALGAYNGGERKGEAIALRARGPDDFSTIAEEGLGTFVDFQDGQFVASWKRIDGQPAPTGHAVSASGIAWTELDAPLPAKRLADAYFRQSKKRIERSQDGENWEPVTDELPGGISGFAEGWVEP